MELRIALPVAYDTDVVGFVCHDVMSCEVGGYRGAVGRHLSGKCLLVLETASDLIYQINQQMKTMNI